MSDRLTADGRRGLEDGRDILVHRDEDVLLVGHLLVAPLDLGLHPIRELLLQHRGTYIRQPLLRRLRQLQVRLGQVCVDMRMVLVQELPDLLDAEAVVSVGRKMNMGECKVKGLEPRAAWLSLGLTYCGMWMVLMAVVRSIFLRPPSNSFKK